MSVCQNININSEATEPNAEKLRGELRALGAGRRARGSGTQSIFIYVYSISRMSDSALGADSDLRLTACQRRPATGSVAAAVCRSVGLSYCSATLLKLQVPPFERHVEADLEEERNEREEDEVGGEAELAVLRVRGAGGARHLRDDGRRVVEDGGVAEPSEARGVGRGVI